ncbi:MAG: hypothetical protein WB616_14000 [Candidatus Sulfotelmatobacter sp.]
MVDTTAAPEMESLHAPTAATQAADASPQVSSTFILPDFDRARHAASMTDQELVEHVQSKLRPVGQTLRLNIAYIREARNRFAQPGRRVPIAGQPTFAQWIRENLGISDRHVRRLLAAADPTQKLKKQQRRDATYDMAVTMAHAVLGLHEADPDDPSCRKRKAALTNMAFRLLRQVRHKPLGMHVTVKELQPGQFEELYDAVSDCLGEQLDQVLGPLDEEKRADALRLFAQKIARRYVGCNPPVADTNSVLRAEPPAPEATDPDGKVENANVTREDQPEASV